MNCCAKCFIDEEVIAFISSNATQTGSCDFCGENETNIIPAQELYEEWEGLLLSYTPVDDDEQVKDAKELHKQLMEWNIFNPALETKVVKLLVEAIGGSLFKEIPELFTQLTLPEVFSNSANQQQAEEINLTWSKFKEEIKSVNRFFIQNIFESRRVKDILRSYEKSYKKGKIFYRARNSTINGWDIANMGRPPSEVSTPGRANPKGISYLYLANDLKTTLFEVRAAIYDYVTIAEFKLSSEVNVVSLRHSGRISPFKLSDKIDQYLLHERFVQSLHDDLKKPLRRQDTELEYLPTQYLCELIKFLGYDGVEYGSSMNPSGFNLALFSDFKIECSNAKIYEIKSLNYHYDEIIVQ